jgi:hypothetical protein
MFRSYDHLQAEIYQLGLPWHQLIAEGGERLPLLVVIFNYVLLVFNKPDHQTQPIVNPSRDNLPEVG